MAYRHSQKYVNDVQEIKNQVQRFMAEPDLWKDACGGNPIYFVCTKIGRKHGFGLSKCCALRNTTLSRYVHGKRHKAGGGYKTEKRIEQVAGLPWKPIGEVPASVRKEFLQWFGGFYRNAYTKQKLSLMIL